MKNNFKVLIVTILALIINACQSKAKTQDTKTDLESQFYTDSLFSENLSEYRKYNIYLPQNFNKNSKYSIIYATDGSPIISNYSNKKMFDSLISNQIIKPVIYVESHSNNNIADSTTMTTGNGTRVNLSYRNFEFTRDYENNHKNPDLASRFSNHIQYFNDELIPEVEEKLDQNLTKDDRYFYGYSNGAGFGLNLLNNYPETIGTYFCFSTFGGDAQTNEWKPNIIYPNLYLKYGTKEPEVLKIDAEFLKDKFSDLNTFINVEAFEGGHEYKIWKQKFSETLTKILKHD